MLNKMPEWYRMVSPKPTDEMIGKHKLAVKDLTERFAAAEDYTLLVACTAGVANGFENGFGQDSPLVGAVSECISSHQPAFVPDLSESALQYRACCAVALGEVFKGDEDEEYDFSTAAEVTASFFVSAMGLRPQVTQKYLKVVLQDLRESAVLALERAAGVRRQRQGLDLAPLDDIPVPADPASLWEALRPQLKACFETLRQEADVNREELDVLWWLYNGFSRTFDRPVVGLPSGVAALCCGAELADRVITPPLNNIRQMVLQAIDKKRKKSELSAQPLEKMVGQWDDKTWNLLAPSDTGLGQLTQDFPAVLPLSWLCLRLSQSQGAPGWNEEFKLKTGLDPARTYTPAELALQAFNERVAQRIYSEE